MSKEADRSQRRALGKGLSALLPTRSRGAAESEESQPTIAAAAAAPAKQNLPDGFAEFDTIPLSQIRPGKGQPRGHFDEQSLRELADSIRAHGILQPITVHRTGWNEYRIVAGERRWRAAQLAGLEAIPALVREIAGHELLELALIENIQREDLNPIEIALAFQALHAEHGLSHEQIATRTGKDRSTVSNFLRLLRLPPSVRTDLIEGRISMGHAKALVNVANPTEQMAISRSIQDKQLSVRDTEELVRSLGFEGIQTRVERDQRKEEPLDPNIRAALDEIARALGTKVKLVARNSKAGRIEIEYYSSEDLDRIYSVIVRQ